jgi:hypothetical protein
MEDVNYVLCVSIENAFRLSHQRSVFIYDRARTWHMTQWNFKDIHIPAHEN